MITTDKQNNLDLINAIIMNELTKTIEVRYQQAKKEFTEKLDRDMADTLTGISLHIMKMIEIENFGDKLIIKLITEKK